jgi:protein TonB
MSSEAATVSTQHTPEYVLRSDLAQYSLPSAGRDEARKLAWANSVCVLFLIVAFMGLRQPIFVIRDAAPPAEPLPPVILPPVEQEPPPAQDLGDLAPEEEPLEEKLEELPVITPVVVAAPDDVSFAVPVEGYIAISRDSRFVPPPPPVIPRAPPPSIPRPEFRVTRIGDRAFRRQPAPDYPPELERQRIGGTVELFIYVASNGVPHKVEVGRSSGTASLDRYVAEFIQREWRAYPGEAVNYRIAITFAP